MDQVFHFKQFSISQDQCAMKVGTDGVLLGAWSGEKLNPNSILDIGAGSGVISLMMAQRFPDAQIEAIEIEGAAYEQCVENFENSEWSDRLFCYHCSFDQFVEEWEDTYDLIVSNPPFFIEDNTTSNSKRDLARMNSSLPFESLFLGVKKLLSPQGYFSLIAPKQLEASIFNLSAKVELFLSRKVEVKGHPESQTKRVLLEFSKNNQTVENSELIIENSRHNYTEDYINLTKDFYLKF